MANFNKVILIGNLTRDPQLSYLPSQTAVVEFGLAMNRTWTGQDGQKKDETCFIDVRAYGKPAETINHYMAKGQQIMIEGRLQFQQWQAQDGSKRSKHIVIVDSFQFLGGPRSAGDGGGNPNAAVQPPQRRSAAPAARPAQPVEDYSQDPQDYGAGGNDGPAPGGDDIPF
jgi:single-strand DNA-binding protein